MPSRDLDRLIPALAGAWLDLRQAYEALHPGRQLLVTCTYRSPEEQFALYQIGRVQRPDGSWVLDDRPETRIVTQLDGYTRRSKHNLEPAQALDFCVVVGGKASWDPRDYAPVGRLARERGIIWGGDWISFKDYPHLEIASTKGV